METSPVGEGTADEVRVEVTNDEGASVDEDVGPDENDGSMEVVAPLQVPKAALQPASQ